MRFNMEDACHLKGLFENLFGRGAWYEIKHSTDLNLWKKYSTKVLSAIELSAKSTVQVADKEWFSELASEIEYGKGNIHASEDFEMLFSSLAAALGSISFLQLGLVPRRSNRRGKVTLRHASNWKLDNFRSVQYVQSPEQKRESHNKRLR